MKNLTQVFTWLTVVAIFMVCLIGIVLVTMDRFLFDILYYALYFPPLIERFVLQAVIFGSITACLTILYIYIVNRSANKARVRLVYALIGLTVAFAFVFSEYENNQEKLTIRDVCTQFDLAVARRDYETAYEFMSPDYRQTHSLVQYIGGEFGEGVAVGRRVTCEYPHTRITVVLLHPKAREASVTHTPFGTLITEILLEQVDDKWYFTGEIRHFQG